MRDIIQLVENKSKLEKLEIISLNFTEREVSGVMSKATLALHYEKLAQGYADRYNQGIGDSSFNYAGVFLHNILFTQFRKVQNNNKPVGPVASFIDEHFGNFNSLKEKFVEEAMKLHGSGWLYLAKNGTVKTIKNHEVKNDIILLIDMWEHAWVLDYSSDKKKYISNVWKIINWDLINSRYGKSDQ